MKSHDVTGGAGYGLGCDGKRSEAAGHEEGEVVSGDGRIVLYQSNQGDVQLDVRLEEETVWLTQTQIAQLFGKAVSTINEHIKNIYAENELSSEVTCRTFGNSEFSTKPTNFYNLELIISVGYRVRSQQGTQFRIWATQRLKDIETENKPDPIKICARRSR